jgi:hypothetical protein
MCAPFPGAQESLDLIREEEFFNICHIGDPGRGGVGPSRHHILEELTYLARRVVFHQYAFPVIRRQTSFPPEKCSL